MADVNEFQSRFKRIVRDVSRDQLPPDACWNLVDYIPDEGDAPLAKRGGWNYASPALTSVLAGADWVMAVYYAPFASGAQLVGIPYDAAGAGTAKCAQIVSDVSATDRGACNPTEAPLAFFRDRLIIPHFAGTAILDSYGGAANVADLAASAPTAKFVAAYKDHLAAAYSSANKERVWFSPAGDPAGTWDTANAWFDTTGPVHGLYPLRNALLIFHEQGPLERLIGATPPPATDMALQQVSADVGLNFAFSIAGTEDFAIFANSAGVFMTDGSAVSDLTQEGGIKSYWDELIDTAGTTWQSAGAFIRNYYIVTVRSSATFRDCLACHVPSRAWFRFSNITAQAFAKRLGGLEEIYWGDFGEARVNTFHDIFNPVAGSKNDDDATAIVPIVESGYRRFKGRGRIKHLYVDYDLRDAATDNPLLTLSYITTPEATSYTTVKKLDGSTSDTLAETTASTYTRRRVAEQARGVAWKLAQTNPSASTQLFRVGMETHELEPSRR